jgi:hypothetical protein
VKRHKSSAPETKKATTPTAAGPGGVLKKLFQRKREASPEPGSRPATVAASSPGRSDAASSVDGGGTLSTAATLGVPSVVTTTIGDAASTISAPGGADDADAAGAEGDVGTIPAVERAAAAGDQLFSDNPAEDDGSTMPCFPCEGAKCSIL